MNVTSDAPVLHGTSATTHPVPASSPVPAKGGAFVHMQYLPADEHTAAHISKLADDLGLDPNGDADVRCLCGVFMAVRKAKKKGTDYFCFSGKCEDYTASEVGYRKVGPILRHLKAVGFLTLVRSHVHGLTSAVYRAEGVSDEGLRFADRGKGRVRVREPRVRVPGGGAEEGPPSLPK
jgi:hypothetical protein